MAKSNNKTKPQSHIKMMHALMKKHYGEAELRANSEPNWSRIAETPTEFVCQNSTVPNVDTSWFNLQNTGMALIS